MSKELLGSLELNRIYQMNCLDGMKLLPNGTSEIGIDLTVTSPPYDDLRKYKGYSFEFESIAKELYRITKDGGVVVWIVGDQTMKGSESGTSFKQALYFKEIGFNLHDTMIYRKLQYRPLTHNRYEQEFEYMFILSKGKPKIFNPIMIPCKKEAKKDSFLVRGVNGEDEKRIIQRKTHRIKGNVFEYNTGNNLSTKDKIAFKHPAIFPERLAEDHIASWSNEGDIILDCFMGSGTTAKMATLNKRKWLGFETSREYIEIANKRLDDLETV
ncbi:DNA-methyltransferase [Metabacillus fastidiosus]|uniref:DNA-methyltransferase n=1 Tax=Metabacillus fastidiosus TaxID=1458 RepID=UPI003D2848D6